VIWRACERLGIMPPDVPRSWDSIPDEDNWIKAHILVYHQIREHEENEVLMTMMKASAMRPHL
jgi:hypothetical protein